MAVFLLYSKVYRHERIWPRDSLEAPAADDGRLLENEERLGGIIRKRKLLRLGVVAGGGVVVSPGGGGGGGGGSCFREDLTLSPLGLLLHAEPAQRDRLAPADAEAAAAEPRPAPVGRPGRRERRAHGRPGHPSGRPPRQRRRRGLGPCSGAPLFRHHVIVTTTPARYPGRSVLNFRSTATRLQRRRPKSRLRHRPPSSDSIRIVLLDITWRTRNVSQSPTRPEAVVVH